jgi:hypothetical protein
MSCRSAKFGGNSLDYLGFVPLQCYFGSWFRRPARSQQ